MRFEIEIADNIVEQVEKLIIRQLVAKAVSCSMMSTEQFVDALDALSLTAEQFSVVVKE